MRRILSIAFLMIFIIANAQFRTKNKQQNRLDSDNQDFSFGYYLGVNLFDFKLHPNEAGLSDSHRFLVESEPQMGFHAGLIAKWKLSNNFDFKVEPGVYFTQKNLIFHNVKPFIGTDIDYNYLNDNGERVYGNTYMVKAEDTLRVVKGTYIDIPVFINLHGNRWHNTRPYMQFGIGWMVNLQSNEKKPEDSFVDGILRTKTHNFNWQFEMGVDIYFSRFKLTPAVKGIFLFNNELVADDAGIPKTMGKLAHFIIYKIFSI